MAFLVATDWGFGVLVSDLKQALAGGLGRAGTDEDTDADEGTRRRPGRALVALYRRGRDGWAALRARRAAARAAVAGGGAAVAEPERDEDLGTDASDDDVEVEAEVSPRRRRLRRKRREAEQPVAGQLQEDGPGVGTSPQVPVEAGDAPEADDEPDEPEEDGEDTAEAGEAPGRARPAPRPEPSKRPITITGEVQHKAPRPRRRKSWGNFVLPPLDLLEIEPQQSPVADRRSLERAADAIERRLSSHRIDAKVVEISAGPAITLFELEVGEGQRLAALRNFAPDLAAALKALSVRIVAPIPGKHTVGVEVPNAKRSLVYLRELIETYRGTQDSVPLFLGRNVSGKPIVADLARMPHLLIAGATGSGKSVCINSIL
ncbi:MAG: DNA translocase FtsK, partial [Planctomycetota bacterium]